MLYRLWKKSRIVIEDWQPTSQIGLRDSHEVKSFVDYEWRPLDDTSGYDTAHLKQLEVELGILLSNSLFRGSTIKQLPQARGFVLFLREDVQAETVIKAIPNLDGILILSAISKLPGFDKVTFSYMQIGGKWSRELVAYFRPEVKANVDELQSPKCERASDSGNQISGGGDNGLDTVKEPTGKSQDSPTVSDEAGAST